MIGLDRKTVKLFSYSPKWTKNFEKEKKILRDILGDKVIDIQHIGSTAIPELLAKPIIDILIAVSDLKRVKGLIRALKKIDYEYEEDEGGPDRLFFAKGDEAKITHHLHFVRINSRAWKDNLLFRDYLRKHKEIVGKYADLKRELIKKFPKDRESYLSGKVEFIEAVIKKSKKEFLWNS